MSVEVRIKLICDGCGQTIEGAVGHRSTLLWESLEDARIQALKKKWLTAQRYGTARHYCQRCADGAHNARNQWLAPQGENHG